MKTEKKPDAELKPEDALLDDTANAMPENGGIPAPEVTEGDSGNAPYPPGTAEKTVPVMVRHTTEYPKYRRAGLVLSQKPEPHEVTEAQLAALKKDPWIEVIEK
ncbi:MAG: hypothetical protein LBP76_14690 [Treponema sp.]|jgi:hypothetical protein|nr:hypothetical protein [Treponema sp.]